MGRAVGELLDRPFLDFDREIERRSGLAPARFFAERGEPAFRAFEVALTEELAPCAPMVLSPGGGWVTNPGVIERLRPPGLLVHLRIAPATALWRLSKSRIARPLLAAPDPQARMEALWEQRAHLYNMADVTIDVEHVEQQRLIESVAALARGARQGIG